MATPRKRMTAIRGMLTRATKRQYLAATAEDMIHASQCRLDGCARCRETASIVYREWINNEVEGELLNHGQDLQLIWLSEMDKRATALNQASATMNEAASTLNKVAATAVATLNQLAAAAAAPKPTAAVVPRRRGCRAMMESCVIV